MASIKLTGDTSGEITIAAPAVAGTNTLTLPANTGNIITTGDSGTITQGMIGSGVASTGPAFYAKRTSVQSVTSGVSTKIQFNVEEIDTDGCYDHTTNYRFTPTVAGYYHISARGQVDSTADTFYSNWYLFKNGGNYSQLFGGNGNGGSFYHGSGSILVYLNGSTDYIELYCTQTATLNVQGFLCGHLVRKA